MGIRSAAPIPIKAMRISVATTVYGRFQRELDDGHAEPSIAMRLI